MTIVTISLTRKVDFHFVVSCSEEPILFTTKYLQVLYTCKYDIIFTFTHEYVQLITLVTKVNRVLISVWFSCFVFFSHFPSDTPHQIESIIIGLRTFILTNIRALRGDGIQ